MRYKLEKSAIEWFRTNYFKLNTDKCKLIVGGRKSHSITARVGTSLVEEVSSVKLLGINIDNKLNFNEHTLIHEINARQ